MKAKHLLVILAVLGVLGAVAYQFVEPNKSASEQPDLVAGEALYQKNCASCHGVNLEGQPRWNKAQSSGVLPAPPHDKTGHTWHHNDMMLFRYTKFGGAWFAEQQGLENFKSGMPGFEKSLKDEEIHAILAYIRSTWPEAIQKRQARLNR